MMKTIIAVVAFATLLTAWSCGSSPRQSEALADAELALEAHNYTAAQAAADQLLAQSEDSPLTAADYGRLSLLFIRLSEVADADADNVGQATQCYFKAFAANPDSARAFYNSLPLETAVYIEMLANLSHAITSPTDIADDGDWCCDSDSITSTTDNSHEH